MNVYLFNSFLFADIFNELMKLVCSFIRRITPVILKIVIIKSAATF